MTNFRWDAVCSSKRWRRNMCSSLAHWLPHSWGFRWNGLAWEGGQVLESSLSPSSIRPRYDSDGNYLDSLPALATPRDNHGCTTFFAGGEQVKLSTCCPTFFPLYLKQALIVAGGSYCGSISSTEIYLPSINKWTRGGNLPRWKYLSNHLNSSLLSLQLSSL